MTKLCFVRGLGSGSVCFGSRWRVLALVDTVGGAFGERRRFPWRSPAFDLNCWMIVSEALSPGFRR